MSTGGSSEGTAGVLDVGTREAPADNTFDPSTTTAGPGVPAGAEDPGFFPGYWTYTPTETGWLTLDTGATEGGGLPDTVLHVVVAGDLYAEDDDSGDGRLSRLGFTVTAGVTYIIDVGAFADDGGELTLYRLAATFTLVPVLPYPREFCVSGGTQTEPGLVMDPGVVNAPQMPPLSVSLSTDGSLPDATFVFDATAYLATLGIPGAYITFDATLSYLTSGQSDEFAPEVGLNIFTVPHGLPFTWEEPWDTLEIGENDGVDDYGRDVPRGQWTQFVVPDTTYIIQLTTPPGNDVRFILRVSDWGAHTGLLTLPDQQWRVTRDPYGGDGGVPITYGPETIPFARATSPSGLFGSRDVDTTFPPWDLLTPFEGTKSLLEAAAAPNPITDAAAIACAWTHARRGKAGTDFWSSNFNGDGTAPAVCRTITDHESGGLNGVGMVGYHYEGQALIGGQHRLDWDVYDSQFRLPVIDLLAFFGPTAGIDPFALTPPVGIDPDSPALFTVNPSTGTPDLLGVDIAQDQLDEGDVASEATRMYVSAVTEDNADGSSDPWGPAEDAAAPTEHWRGTTTGPEDYDSRHATQFTDPTWLPLPDGVYDAAVAAEAAGTGDFNGGLSVVGLFDQQFSDGLPTPAPAGGVETIDNFSTYQYPVLRFRLRPTTEYWFADLSILPPAAVCGDVLRLTGRDDARGASTALRTHSMSKATRVAGSYPPE